MWQTPLNGLFTDDWWKWFLSNYSYFLALIPAVFVAGIKLAAIIHPSVESDKILDWVKQVFYKA